MCTVFLNLLMVHDANTTDYTHKHVQGYVKFSQKK
jgi:hypothetical protein